MPSFPPTFPRPFPSSRFCLSQLAEPLPLFPVASHTLDAALPSPYNEATRGDMKGNLCFQNSFNLPLAPSPIHLLKMKQAFLILEAPVLKIGIIHSHSPYAMTKVDSAAARWLTMTRSWAFCWKMKRPSFLWLEGKKFEQGRQD